MKAMHGWAATATLAVELTLALALCGCGGAADESADAAAEDAGSHALLDAAQEPLERARAVEDISQGHKAQLDEEIEDAAR